ncbi:hypothetical protein CCR75_007914 [Bremia lactucae]|uniref:Uncharacterized protein n=1 Tax=Bremia lactucae TaxID=4779 RepID=A0A976IH25_BRELC|nr:hypothetical protein CCR75_007914 [Bremia lactucae]
MRWHILIFTHCQAVNWPAPVSIVSNASDILSDWIRDVEFLVPGPAADHNGISARIGVPRHIVRAQKPARVDPVPGCAQAATISKIIAAIELAQRQVDDTASVYTSDCLTARRLAD